MIMGQVGEYRELSLEERREHLAQDVREMGQVLEGLPTEQTDTKTIAGKFAEALGCLEDALCWLGQVNEHYDHGHFIAGIRLAMSYGQPSYNRATDFWLQAELAEDALKVMLGRLQRVEPLAPKEEVT